MSDRPKEMHVAWREAHLVERFLEYLDAHCRSRSEYLRYNVTTGPDRVYLEFYEVFYDVGHLFTIIVPWEDFVKASDKSLFAERIVERALRSIYHNVRIEYPTKIRDQISLCRMKDTTTALIGLAVATNGTLVVRTEQRAADLRRRHPTLRAVGPADPVRGDSGPLFYDTDVVGWLADRVEG